MRWIDSCIEKITHRHMLETQITQLREELSRANDRLDEQQKAYDKHLEEALRADAALSGLTARVQQLQEDTERDDRLAAVERDRTELFRHIDDLSAQVQQLQENTAYDDRLAVVEQDRTELFRRINDLSARVQQLQEDTERDDRLVAVEQDRTELFRRIDDLSAQVQQLQEDTEYDDRLAVVEQDRTKLFRRIDDLDALVQKLQENTEWDDRLAVVEQDRTELFHRIDDLDALVQQLQQNASQNGRLEVLEQDRTELFARVTALQKTVDEGSVYSLKKCSGDEELNSRVIPLNQYLKGSGIALSMHLTSTEKVLDESVYHTSDLTRTSTLAMIADEIRDKSVEGSVAELGVAQGDFAEVINAHFPDKKLFLFDTFEGFPDSDVRYEQDNGYSNPLSHWYTDINIRKVLERMRYPENCIVKKGYFPDTAEGVNEQFCFVSIDCDLYKPIYSGLAFFYPRLVKGGYIFVHDYRSKYYRGVREALKKFADEQGISYCVLPDNTGTAIIIK